MALKVGQRVRYQRYGKSYCGVIESVEQGELCGLFYFVRNDASQIRNAVLPQQISR